MKDTSFTDVQLGFDKTIDEQQILDLAEGYRSDLVARNTLVKACKTALIPVLNSSYTLANYDENNVDNIHMRDTLRIDARIPSEKDKLSEYVNDTDSAIGVVSVKKSAVSFGVKSTSGGRFLLESAAKKWPEKSVQRRINEKNGCI